MSYTGHSLRGVLPLCRGAVGVFYSPSRLGNICLYKSLLITVHNMFGSVSVSSYLSISYFSYLFISAHLSQSVLAQSDEAVEYIHCFSAEGNPTPHQWVSWIWYYTIWWWGSSNAWALGNAQYPFIAITPKSTLAWSGSTWWGPICRSNRSKLCN